MNHIQDPKILKIYGNIKNKTPSTANHFAILKLSIKDEELLKKYEKRAGAHNKKLLSNLFYDSGFDIFLTKEEVIENEHTTYIDYGIKAEMLYCNVDKDLITNTPFLLHPRSSMSKLPIMLSNHTGIIDSGYRGNIIGAFRNLDTQNPCSIEKDTRLLQICHPSLCPIFIVFLDENELTPSERGAGSFGSTGFLVDS
jgi:dUTPase